MLQKVLSFFSKGPFYSPPECPLSSDVYRGLPGSAGTFMTFSILTYLPLHGPPRGNTFVAL